MSRHPFQICVALALACAGGVVAAAADQPPSAWVGATLVDGSGAPPVEDSVLLVEGARILCAGDAASCPIPEGAEVRQVAERWIVPGLIDGHMHFSQTGWADGRPDFLDLRETYPYEEVIGRLRREPRRFFRSYLCSGVTGVFDVGGYPWTWELRERFEGDLEAPHVAAAGPLLSTVDFWLNLPGERQFVYLADEETAREGVRYLAAQGADAVKIWFIVGNERPFEEMEAAVRAAGDEARRSGVPLIVHATGLREARVAVEAGAHLLVHSVWDRAVDDEFVRVALEQGTLYCPTLTVMAGYQRLAEAIHEGRAPEVDDPNGCLDSWTLEKLAAGAELGGDFFAPEMLEARRRMLSEREHIGAANLARLVDAGVPVVMGTDAGNPLTLHGPSVYAELEAMAAAGMTPMQVLVAATRNAARAMGREADLGMVEAGKVADFLILAADPLESVSAFRQIEQVVRGGIARTPAQLRPLD